MTKKELEEKVTELRGILEKNAGYHREDCVRIKKREESNLLDFKNSNYSVDKQSVVDTVIIIVATLFVFSLLSFCVGVNHGMSDSNETVYDSNISFIGYKSKCESKPKYTFTKYNPGYRLGCLIGEPLEE